MAEKDRVQAPNAGIGNEGSGEEEQPYRVFPRWCCDRVFDKGKFTPSSPPSRACSVQPIHS